MPLTIAQLVNNILGVVELTPATYDALTAHLTTLLEELTTKVAAAVNSPDEVWCFVHNTYDGEVSYQDGPTTEDVATHLLAQAERGLTEEGLVLFVLHVPTRRVRWELHVSYDDEQPVGCYLVMDGDVVRDVGGSPE